MASGAKRAAGGPDCIVGQGQLPKDWRWKRLGDVFPLSYGKSLPLRDRAASGSVPVYGSSGRVGLHSTALISGPAVLVGRKGAAGSVHFSAGPCWPIDTAYFVESGSGGLDLRYGYHLLQHIRLGTLDQSTAIPSLSRDTYADQIVPVAPDDIQLRVASRIDELFAEIDGGEQALAAARKSIETYSQSLLKSAVTGELTADWRANNGQEETGESLLRRVLADRRARGTADPKNARRTYAEVAPPDPASLPSLPTGWAWTTVECLTTGDRGAVVIGPFGSDLKVSDYTENGVPLVFVRHIRAQDFVGQRPQRVSPAKAKALKAHEAIAGDLLITKMGDPPGDVAIYPNLVPAIITADCIRWRPHPLLNNEFLAAWIGSFWGQAWIAKHTKGVAQQKITLENFKSMPVAVPGPNEQSAIVAAVKSGFAFVDEIRALTDPSAATSLRQSVLAAAFRGDLVA